ncbi:lactoylglutathione lyase [Hwanghaeella grinnelliae]|uniref:Lactoylglutathione lyase n=1 Tax=Hwanghaeella grinnelliae TaxID=2500179 RepID=A0A3S2W3T0_9PROT|nr:VOC family protein [Hwanghaeella grinnelliae]RVU35766.1 lactoylglutathione lyase [Hwanghaeella grinnelliae]
MAKLIHTMIRVLEEERSVKFYAKAFGMKVSRRLDKDTFTLVYLRGEETDQEVELTINKGQSEAYSHGEGYGHIAFVVDDLEAEHQRFEAEGLHPRNIVEFKDEEALIAKFFFVQDPDGYQIEVLQKHGHYQ